METTIFYFSTTGNSLALARSMGEGLGGTTLISISKALGVLHSIQSERVGFVFPVYAWAHPAS